MKRLSGFSTLIFVLAILAAACSGGGGGGGGLGGITYDGVTTQAPLTAANANEIFSMMWNGGMSMGSVSLSPAISKSASSGDSKEGGIVSLAKGLRARLTGGVSKFSGGTKKMRSAVPVNETIPGAVSGTLTMTGSIDDTTLTGSMTMTYTNFNDGDGYTIDGVVTVRVDGFDSANGILTDATMSFTAWTIKATDVNFALGGSVRMQESMQNKSDTVTINMNGRDNIGNDSFKFENYVETTVYDNLFYPSTGSETYSGRVYAGKYGYVDVGTVSPCVYSNPYGDPGSGGPIILAGAGNTRAAITPLSTTYVKIEVDNNGDGAYEDKNTYAWSNLDGAPANVAPFADAGLDQTVSVGSLVALYGWGSTDPTGSTLTYAWTMTAKPAGSNAALSSPLLQSTIFTADVIGTYTINLVVSNGTKSSSPDTVVITATTGVTTGGGAVLASIVVSPINPTITKGTTQQFMAMGVFSDSSTQDLTTQVIWNSSDTTKASISSAGLATGIDSGQTVISATAGLIVGTTTLTVQQPIVPFVWASASAGYSSSFAIKLDHTLWAWGDNLHGQLGDGTNISRSTPVPAMPGTSWKSVSSGGAFAFTASSSYPTSHTMAIKSDNTLWAWGYNDKGQLGNGTTADTNAPVQIGTDSNWAFISAGQSHTVAIKSDGTLWAWGYNYYGALGDGTLVDKTVPVQIGTSTDWAVAGAGAAHTVAIKSDGTLWAWGANYDGQLGDGTNVGRNAPTQIGNETNWASVSVGFSHAVAIKTDGTLWVWGDNVKGQLGDGTTTVRNAPIQIGTETSWKSVAAGYYDTFAVKTDGTLWAWGWNSSGRLGDGTIEDKHAPVRIGVTANWAYVTAGVSHTMAVTTDGTLWAWGENASGQLGDGTRMYKDSPTNIP